MLPLKDKRIRIGGWWSADPDLISDEYVKLIAESGADFIMTAKMEDTAKINELLDYCDKYDVECVLYDGRTYDLEDADMAGITAGYRHHPSYVGSMIKDEPGSSAFPHLRIVYDKFKAEVPGKNPYINLFPMYASDAQLLHGLEIQEFGFFQAHEEVYANHIDEYCKTFDTPYICADVYPCRTASDGVTRSIYPGYLENLSILTHYCRKYNRDLWIMVQTLVWYHPAVVPNETDLRWQFFTVMAFGATAIFHYCLATPPGHSPGLLDSEGKRSPLFYPAQRFHRYLKSISDIYLGYKHLGCFNVNCDDDHPYLQFKEQYTDFDTIKEVVTDEQLLVGCFGKEDGSGHAFVLVNMTHLCENKTAEVKLKLANATRVTAHLDGITMDIAPVDGYYNFKLDSGEGVFVTVE